MKNMKNDIINMSESVGGVVDINNKQGARDNLYMFWSLYIMYGRKQLTHLLLKSGEAGNLDDVNKIFSGIYKLQEETLKFIDNEFKIKAKNIDTK